MTPKEKAKELLTKMMMQGDKQCALIAVDELIDSFKKVEKYFESDITNPVIYFQNVKKEIEKL